jgi:hypothetical protein
MGIELPNLISFLEKNVPTALRDSAAKVSDAIKEAAQLPTWTGPVGKLEQDTFTALGHEVRAAETALAKGADLPTKRRILDFFGDLQGGAKKFSHTASIEKYTGLAGERGLAAYAKLPGDEMRMINNEAKLIQGQLRSVKTWQTVAAVAAAAIIIGAICLYVNYSSKEPAQVA